MRDGLMKLMMNWRKLGAKTIIDFAMPISGLCSTILEVIDSVGKDD